VEAQKRIAGEKGLGQSADIASVDVLSGAKGQGSFWFLVCGF
jgi:hypothetical protein